MAQVLDEVNKDLLAELYELKKQIKSAQFLVLEKDKKISELEKHKLDNDNNDLDEFESKLKDSEEKIAELQKVNAQLNKNCIKLYHDNVNLTQQLSTLSSQSIQQAIMLQKAQVEMQNSNKVKLQTLQQVENQLKMQSESEDTNSNSDQASVESQPKVEELNENVEVAMVVNEKTKQNINKRKVLTIATKLKLTRVQPTPAVAESSPKFYSPRVKSQSKGRSIMVGGLFRGLTPIDIVEYFGGFGDVIDHNEPQGSLEQQEGTKYMFLKFKHSHTVDNVIGQHTIKNIKIGAKKSFKDL